MFLGESFLNGILEKFKAHIMGEYAFSKKELDADYMHNFAAYENLREMYLKNKKPSLKLVRQLTLVK